MNSICTIFDGQFRVFRLFSSRELVLKPLKTVSQTLIACESDYIHVCMYVYIVFMETLFLVVGYTIFQFLVSVHTYSCARVRRAQIRFIFVVVVHVQFFIYLFVHSQIQNLSVLPISE